MRVTMEKSGCFLPRECFLGSIPGRIVLAGKTVNTYRAVRHTVTMEKTTARTGLFTFCLKQEQALSLSHLTALSKSLT